MKKINNMKVGECGIFLDCECERVCVWVCVNE